MKVTDSETIKSGERELIDTIIGDLDWTAIENIFRQRHNLAIHDDVEFRKGDIVVHDNQIAYKLDFEVKVSLSVLFDRQGDAISLQTQEDDAASLQDVPATGQTETLADAPEAEPALDEIEPLTEEEEEEEEAIPAPDKNAGEPGPAQTDWDADPTEGSTSAADIADMISDINDN